MKDTPLWVCFLAACASSATCPEPTIAPVATTTPVTTPVATTPPATTRPRDAIVELAPRPELAHHFTDVGYAGSFAAWRADGSLAVCVGDCGTRRPAASTFKIPHALLALDLGVLDGPEHLLAWDGQTRSFASWNRDHTLRTAIRDSAVWYFQRLAPFVGRERMQAGLERFAFGNATIGEALDAFWLDGTLRVSPREQVAFWHRLHGDAFDVRPEARDAVLDMTILARDEQRVLRGKTGWFRLDGSTRSAGSAADGSPANVGWLVGCVEEHARPDERVCFATVLEVDTPDDAAFMRARHTLSATLLRELGVTVPAY
jgi:beta-lactamase class D